MQTIDTFVKQQGYLSVDDCIELYRNEICTDEVGLWRTKEALVEEFPMLSAPYLHWLLSAIMLLRLMEKGGHAVPAIIDDGKALLDKLQYLPAEASAQQLAQYCLDHPDFGADGCGVCLASDLTLDEREQGWAAYRMRLPQGYT